MFSHHPQAVEVYQAGTWWAGELLGWRHEADGSCRMCVRVVLGGTAETAWVDLAGLRLPEQPAAAAPGAVSGASLHAVPAATAPRQDASTTQKLPRAAASRPERPGPRVATAGLPPTRTQAAAAPAPGRSGRRRAPEELPTSAVTAQPPMRPGGRRRAPEPAEQPAVPAAVPAARNDVAAAVLTPSGGGRRRAPEPVGADRVDPLTDAVPAAGRHRPAPPAAQGRHRTAAETGMFASVQIAAPVATPTGAHPVGRAPAVPLPRTPTIGRGRSGAAAGPWGGGTGGGSGDGEPELLTRPMRLSDHLPGARRSAVDAR